MKARISVDIEVVIHEGEPDEGGYWAEVPSLPGCVSEGETMHEMLANIKEAIECHLEAIAEPSPPKATAPRADAPKTATKAPRARAASKPKAR